MAGEEISGLAPDDCRRLFDELGEHVGYIDTWPVYRLLHAFEFESSEQELYRYQFDIPDTNENRSWLATWRQAQEQKFGLEFWMIHYRVPG